MYYFERQNIEEYNTEHPIPMDKVTDRHNRDIYV